MLANRNPSDSARKLYTQELGQIDAQSESLKKQLAEIAMSTGGATRQPSLDEAVGLGQLLDDARKDLRSDLSTLFRLYDEFDRARLPRRIEGKPGGAQGLAGKEHSRCELTCRSVSL